MCFWCRCGVPLNGFGLRLVSPDFDSSLTDTLIELNHLRRLRLGGTTAPWIFFQLKNIFHILESVGSARIEGNRTTISEYIEKKIENRERSSERFSEIANVEAAMEFIEQYVHPGEDVGHHFIRELHQLVVGGLEREGDRTPGAYRNWMSPSANLAMCPLIMSRCSAIWMSCWCSSTPAVPTNTTC